MTKGKDWTSRLITGLFTAAAAWGSVSVEINRVVNARAELTEQRLEQRIQQSVDGAVLQIERQAATVLDSLANRPAPVLNVPAPVVVAQSDTITQRHLEETNERLRYVAIAIARMEAEIKDMRDAAPKPKLPRPSPYGR